MDTKIFAAGTMLAFVIASPAFAQSVTTPSANEKQVDFKRGGLDRAPIAMDRMPADGPLTSTDVRPVLGTTLIDTAGKPIGSIIRIQNDTKGQPENLHIQLGKEDTSPVRVVSARTVSLRNGRVVTTMTAADVQNMQGQQ